jgi:ATP-dependent helicase/nuclease subunit A
MQAVRAVVQDLRLRRHRQPPGATARDLIERTALGRVVSAGPNGRQTLAALYDIAAELDRRAAVDALDFDAVTELCRVWARDPAALDAAQPLGPGALRVITVHGAKGLEFPVVILWDGFQTLNEFGPVGGWHAQRDGHAWALSLGPVAIEHPPNAGLFEHERTFAEAERRRLYYVAATRARDLLVVPVPQTRGQRLQYATTALAGDAALPHVRRFETFQLEQPPLWGRWESADAAPRIVADAARQAHLDAARDTLARALTSAAQSVAVPVAASLAAAETAADGDTETGGERTRKAADSRFGTVFGLTVHRALELLATGCIADVGAAVAVAIDAEGLTEHRTAVRDDVLRAQRALQLAGFFDPAAVRLTEFPLTMRQPGGRLVSGYADLVVMCAEALWVVDYKTNTPRSGPLARAYPLYAAQLRLYARMLQAAAVVGARRLHLGLLFTATGELCWLDGDAAAAT